MRNVVCPILGPGWSSVFLRLNVFKYFWPLPVSGTFVFPSFVAALSPLSASFLPQLLLVTCMCNLELMLNSRDSILLILLSIFLQEKWEESELGYWYVPTIIGRPQTQDLPRKLVKPKVYLEIKFLPNLIFSSLISPDLRFLLPAWHYFFIFWLGSSSLFIMLLLAFSRLEWREEGQLPLRKDLIVLSGWKMPTCLVILSWGVGWMLWS